MRYEAALPRLAAVLSDGDGVGDEFMSSLADTCLARGLRVGGVVQANTLEPGACRCDMVLIELTTRTQIKISQNLGGDARGCRLDSNALERMAGLVESSVARPLDVVILNKFGKRESEGAGLRQAILRFIDRGVPVLVGLNRANLEGWRDFAGGLGEILPVDREATTNWIAASIVSRRSLAF